MSPSPSNPFNIPSDDVIRKDVLAISREAERVAQASGIDPAGTIMNLLVSAIYLSRTQGLQRTRRNEIMVHGAALGYAIQACDGLFPETLAKVSDNG